MGPTLGYARRRMMEARRELEAASVANFRQPAKLLTDKERARFDTVTVKLAKGKNPYQGTTAIDSGGSLLDVKIVIPKPDDSAAIALLASKWDWQNVEPAPTKEVVYLDEPTMFEAVQVTAPRVVPAGMVECSFCNALVDQVNATQGKGEMRGKMVVEFVHGLDGTIIDVEEKWRFYQKKATSCPNCVLKLKSVKFPETEG